MTDNRIISGMKAHFELEALYERTWNEWIADCNAKGLEIFYDMSNPNTVSHGCDDDCSDDCKETMKIGQYNTRPCTQPFHGRKGHRCNPPKYARITGIGA